MKGMKLVKLLFMWLLTAVFINKLVSENMSENNQCANMNKLNEFLPV